MPPIKKDRKSCEKQECREGGKIKAEENRSKMLGCEVEKKTRREEKAKKREGEEGKKRSIWGLGLEKFDVNRNSRERVEVVLEVKVRED